MAKQNKKILTFERLESQKLGRLLFWTCFISYALLFFGRSNYSAALPSLVDAQTGFFTKDQAGLVSTAFFGVYAIGQFVNGMIAEKIPPFGLIGTAMLLASLSNLAMYLATAMVTPSLYILIIIWMINGYAQSFVYTSYMRIIATILPEKQQTAASTNLVMGAALGPVLALLVSQQILRVSDQWQLLFLAGFIVICVATVLWFAVTRKPAKLSYRYVDAPAPNTEPIKSTANTSAKQGMPFLPLLLISGALLITIPGFIFTFAREGFQTWAPTYIKELFNASPAFAVAVSTVIPLLGIFGPVIGRTVFEKMFHCELKTIAFLFGIASCATLCIVAFALNSLVGTLVLVAVAYTSLMGINAMVIGLIPMRFVHHGKTATMTGFLNSICCLGVSVSNYLIGLWAENFNWRITFLILAFMMILGIVICLVTTRRWTRFKNS